MIEMGLVVAAGLLVLWCKLNWRNKIRALSNPLLIDLAIFVLLTVLHWGTFSGVLVASIAAFFTSVILSGLRWAYGHTEGGKYIAGKFSVAHKLA